MIALDQLLKDIGRKIALTRKSKQLNQRDAAEKARISYRYFQSIESGRANMTLSTLHRLASLFEVQICDFFPEHGNSVSTPVTETAQNA